MTADKTDLERPAASAHNKRTRLDRSIQIILPYDPDQTPSRQQGLSARDERRQRLQGTALIWEAGGGWFSKEAGLTPSCCVTACVLLHRFYHRVSLQEYDVWRTAMASLVLAAKIQLSRVLPLSHLIHVFAHLYRQRLLILADLDHTLDEIQPDLNPMHTAMLTSHSTTTTSSSTTSRPEKIQLADLQRDDGIAALPGAWTMTFAEKVQHLRRHATVSLSPLGPVWQEWQQAITETEHAILRQLGFTLYWIPDQQHPHQYLRPFLQVLLGKDAIQPAQMGGNGQEDHQNPTTTSQKEEEGRHHVWNRMMAQKAWNYCNDSSRLDLCVRFPTHVIACGAIYLAALTTTVTTITPSSATESRRDLDDKSIEEIRNCILIPPRATATSSTALPWWEVFCGPGHRRDIAVVCHALWSLGAPNNVDVLVAQYAFLRSHVRHEESFNDPDSFLWMMQEQHEAKFFSQNVNK